MAFIHYSSNQILVYSLSFSKQCIRWALPDSGAASGGMRCAAVGSSLQFHHVFSASNLCIIHNFYMQAAGNVNITRCTGIVHASV